MSDQITEYIHREQIRDCIARLARGEDRRNGDAITAAFRPDATIDMGVFRGSFYHYLEWVVPGDPALPVTQHTLGQSVIELDGERAKAETHVLSYHRVDTDEGHRDTIIGGRYLDKLVLRDGQWRIAERTLLYDWFQDFGQAADWSQGVMGMPFTADNYTGRGHGDYSEVFFSE